jgi:hypothetical protein
MLLTAVFALSLSSFTFEVILTRIFSISQWNHLSFMVISIALFGFAASGTLLSILETKKSGCPRRLFNGDTTAVIITLYTLSAIGSFIILNRMPLDYLKLPIEPVQSIYLLTAYLLLALPFFFTGLTICIAYTQRVEKTGVIYFASMTGSAIGAVLPAALLPVLGEENTIFLSSLLPMGLIPFGFRRINKHLQKFVIGGAVTITAVSSLFLFHPDAASMIRIMPSTYKAMRQTLRFPHTKIIETRSGIRGRMDRVESPFIRFAPGLSLKFKGTLPKQEAVFKDGDAPLTFYDLSRPEDSFFSKFTISYSGYLLPDRIDQALVILADGGLAIPCAVASGASMVTVLGKNPYLADLLKTGGRLSIINDTPRSFLAHNRKKFSIIHLENWGASLPGTSALDQSYDFTIEAFAAYLNSLDADGVIIITRKLLLPPSDSIRLWAGAYEGLKAVGVQSPGQHLAVLRNWDSYTLIVSKRPISRKAPIVTFAESMNFDLVYLSGISKEMANRFNVFDAPFHYREISDLSKAYGAGAENAFFKSHPLDIAPQHENRPFPNRHLKWHRLKTEYRTTGSRFYYIFLSGEIVVAVVLLEAMVISLLLLGAPIAGVQKGRRPAFSACIFFFGVGAGFMFIELYFIKLYTALTGDPVVSFPLVLSGLLVFSSTGGFWSQGLKKKSLRPILFIMAGVLGVSIFAYPFIIRYLSGLNGTIRFASAFLLLLPIGFLMGIPFPMGMRYLFDSPPQRAFGWAVNGCASVLAAIAAAQIALSFGISQILFCGLVSYTTALVCVCGRKRTDL